MLHNFLENMLSPDSTEHIFIGVHLGNERSMSHELQAQNLPNLQGTNCLMMGSDLPDLLAPTSILPDLHIPYEQDEHLFEYTDLCGAKTTGSSREIQSLEIGHMLGAGDQSFETLDASETESTREFSHDEVGVLLTLHFPGKLALTFL